jgi:DNA-binding beta-propeller fold protein YncE
VAAGADAFLVVGVRARVVAAYRPNGSLIARATSGAGPTHVAAGTDGWFYVADTNGGRLLVYRLNGDSLKQENSIPVGSKPYGIAFDPSTNDVFVTLTGSNQLVGLRFDGPRVAARWTWATGRQPNSVAVDVHDREAVVAVTGSNAVEMIPLPTRDPRPAQTRTGR